MNNSDLQVVLSKAGYYKGAIDNIYGPLMKQAVFDYLDAYRIDRFWYWGKDRQLIAAKQLACKQAKIDVGKIDGLIGPQTRQAFADWEIKKNSGGDQEYETWRDEIEKLEPLVKPIKNTWPKQSEVTKVFGPYGQNQTMLTLPYPMVIGWDKKQKIKRISVHEKVHDSAERVLKRVHSEYSPKQKRTLGLDIFSGCLAVRRMRGGTKMSMHAWGIAIDFDAERNQLKWGRDKARLAQPDCATFWRLWAEEGWVSLGQSRNYDWMHVQAARL